MPLSTNVLNIPGVYVINAPAGFIRLRTNVVYVTQDLVVGDNTTLGDSAADTIDPIAQFINNLIPQSSYTYSIGTDTNIWDSMHIGKFIQ